MSQFQRCIAQRPFFLKFIEKNSDKFICVLDVDGRVYTESSGNIWVEKFLL